MFGWKGKAVPFSNIRKVVIETSGEHCKVPVTTYRLAISTKTETPMTRYFKAGERYKNDLESIAKLIDDTLSWNLWPQAGKSMPSDWRGFITRLGFEATRFIDELGRNQ